MSKGNTNISNLMRECLQCEKKFIPDESGQECCDNACASVWYGWDDGYYEDDTDYEYECDYECDYDWEDQNDD